MIPVGIITSQFGSSCVTKEQFRTGMAKGQPRTGMGIMEDAHEIRGKCLRLRV